VHFYRASTSLSPRYTARALKILYIRSKNQTKLVNYFDPTKKKKIANGTLVLNGNGERVTAM